MPTRIKMIPATISVARIAFLYLERIVVTHDIPIAASRKGIAIPAEYEDNKTTPFTGSPVFIARVNIVANTGPIQGDQPAENRIPIKKDDKYPAFSLKLF